MHQQFTFQKVLATMLLFVFSISTRAQIVTLDSTLMYPAGLAIHDSTLYFGEREGTNIYSLDLRSPNPTRQVYYSRVNGCDHLYVHQDDLYVASQRDSSIYKIDLNQSPPSKKLVLEHLESPTGLLVNNNSLYFCEAGAHVIRSINLGLSGPPPIHIIRRFGFPSGLAINNNYLYFVEHDSDRVMRVSLGNPQSLPQLVSDKSINEPTGIFLNKNNLYVSTCGGLSVRITTSTNPPSHNGRYFIPACASTIAVFNGEIYFTSHGSGIVGKISSTPLSTPPLLEKEIVVYPNPSNNIIYCKNLNPNDQLTVVDIEGKTIIESSNYTGFVDIEHLEKGIYFLKIKNRLSSKFIKY